MCMCVTFLLQKHLINIYEIKYLTLVVTAKQSWQEDYSFWKELFAKRDTLAHQHAHELRYPLTLKYNEISIL